MWLKHGIHRYLMSPFWSNRTYKALLVWFWCNIQFRLVSWHFMRPTSKWHSNTLILDLSIPFHWNHNGSIIDKYSVKWLQNLQWNLEKTNFFLDLVIHHGYNFLSEETWTVWFIKEKMWLHFIEEKITNVQF